jgi:hypothetical protein
VLQLISNTIANKIIQCLACFENSSNKDLFIGGDNKS